jgi:hydroxyversicolorone monooxygenase
MAPDISHIDSHSSAHADGPAGGYEIPDITFRDPRNRRLKILTIGAGVSGIMMAYQIKKQCQK